MKDLSPRKRQALVAMLNIRTSEHHLLTDAAVRRATENGAWRLWQLALVPWRRMIDDWGLTTITINAYQSILNSHGVNLGIRPDNLALLKTTDDLEISRALDKKLRNTPKLFTSIERRGMIIYLWMVAGRTKDVYIVNGFTDDDISELEAALNAFDLKLGMTAYHVFPSLAALSKEQMTFLKIAIEEMKLSEDARQWCIRHCANGHALEVLMLLRMVHDCPCAEELTKWFDDHDLLEIVPSSAEVREIVDTVSP